MTEVLAIPSDGGSHFASALRPSSSSSFRLQDPPSYGRNTPSLKSKYAAPGHSNPRFQFSSLPSSAPSSPRLAANTFFTEPSFSSTPSSSISLDEQCACGREDDVAFPAYNKAECFAEMKDTAPNSSPESSESSVSSPSSGRFPSNRATDRSDKVPLAGDDTNITHGPTRQVDYLSHIWKEEDIWASWRHIVARKKDYNHSARLENAAWRTWAKSKFRLQTISPEKLNW